MIVFSSVDKSSKVTLDEKRWSNRIQCFERFCHYFYYITNLSQTHDQSGNSYRKTASLLISFLKSRQGFPLNQIVLLSVTIKLFNMFTYFVFYYIFFLD